MSKRPNLALSLAVMGVMLFALPALAQRGFLTGRGGARQARPHRPSRGARQGGYLTGPRSHRFNRGYRSHIAPYGYAPYYSPYYYSDYYSDYNAEQAPSEAPPSRVVVENSQPQPEAPPPPPPESLMLELQGNHWVRITNSGQSDVGPQPKKPDSAKTSSLRTLTPQQSAALESPREVPPAVLVFRDGHKEEIKRYTIVGGTIYTSADYWNNGAWTKKVPLAELNVPATLRMNRERGANFSLPSGPGVVAIRP